MVIERVVLGSLMILALLGLAIGDIWLSAGVPNEGLNDPSGGMLSMVRIAGAPIVAVMAVIIVLATYEMGRLLKMARCEPATHWAAFVNAGLMIIPWVQLQHIIGPAERVVPLGALNHSMTALWLVGAVVGTALALLIRRQTHRFTVSFAATLLMIGYLGLLSSFVIRIRCLYPGPAGAALVLYCVLAIKSADIGAYFTGRFLGRHALAEWLSPNKTVEGLVGGVLMAAAVAAVGVQVWNMKGEALLGTHPLSVTQALIFGALMTFTGHLGDLTESAFKRDVELKHSSGVMSSFGGLLDLTDSLLFALPAAWWLLTILPPMG